MTNLKKIIFVNIILTFLLYLCCDYYVYNKWKKISISQKTYIYENLNFVNDIFIFPISNFSRAIKLADEEKGKSERIFFRKTIFDETAYKKKPILLYGCSFTFGSGLNDNQTLSFKLQKETNRIVYNKGLAGYGIQHMLYHVQYQLENLLNKKKLEEPEFVIYTFIDDHIFRLYKPNDFFDKYAMFYKYDKKNTRLIPISDFDFLFWSSHILRNLYFINTDKTFKYNDGIILLDENKKNFLLKHFVETNKELKEICPNTNFVIFVYNGDYLIKQIEKDLISNKIQIVYLSELTNIDFSKDKYKISDGQHPSEAAWDIIVPLLANKLKL